MSRVKEKKNMFHICKIVLRAFVSYRIGPNKVCLILLDVV